LLTQGTFRPLELEAIMPDGFLIVGLPDSPPSLEVDLIPFRDKIEARPHYIYLCIPYQQKDGTKSRRRARPLQIFFLP